MRVDQLRYRSRKHPPRGKRPQTYTRNAHRSDAPIRMKTAEQTRKTCSRCGRGSHPRDKCLAKDDIISEVTITGSNGSQLDTAFLDTVSANRSSAWFATIGMNEHSIRVKLDTGAEVTAISTETYQMLCKPRLSPPNKLLYEPSRQPLDAAGQFQAEITY